MVEVLDTKTQRPSGKDCPSYTGKHDTGETHKQSTKARNGNKEGKYLTKTLRKTKVSK